MALYIHGFAQYVYVLRVKLVYFCVQRNMMPVHLFFSIFQWPVLFLGETKIAQVKRDNLNEAFGFLETFLTNSKYVASCNVTIADIAIYASISSIVVGIYISYIHISYRKSNRIAFLCVYFFSKLALT